MTKASRPAKVYLEPIPPAWLPRPGARLVGVDEVGRGPLAGPLVAAGVILPPDVPLPEKLRDSKALSPTARERLDAELRALPGIEIFLAEVSPQEIDRLGIGPANLRAFHAILDAAKAEVALVDGDLFLEHPTTRVRSEVRGERFAPVAAASIIAKVYRDRMMAALDAEQPGRGFSSAAYPTPANIAAVRLHGPTEQHRRSFLRKILSGPRPERAERVEPTPEETLAD
jgi:ribonuclease HII